MRCSYAAALEAWQSAGKPALGGGPQPLPHTDNIMAVLYSVFSALFGSTSVVFAKLLAEFLQLSAQGEGPWLRGRLGDRRTAALRLREKASEKNTGGGGGGGRRR